MSFRNIVLRIKEQCPDFVFVDHVLTCPARYDLPAAIITPVKTDAEPPRIITPGAYSQDTLLTVGIYVVVPRRQDAVADVDGAELFDRLCDALRAALVNWQPDWAIEPMQYAGGMMAPYEPGVVTWREDFIVRNELRIT